MNEDRAAGYTLVDLQRVMQRLRDPEGGCPWDLEQTFETIAQFAELHRDIIRRFGRFPHRNAVLGRMPTPEELDYLAEGGFAG